MIGSAIDAVLPAHLQALRRANVGRPKNGTFCVLPHCEDLAADEVNISGRPHVAAASEAARQWRLS
eukprot:scaffold16857_cov52-Phaeocystis_antarctica.AAC.5